MKFDFRVLLFLLSFSVCAEPPVSPPPPKAAADEIQVYTKQSGEAVDALNKTTEVLRDPVKALSPSEADKKVLPAPSSSNAGSLGISNSRELPRDPTQMSGNFKQALKKLNSTPSTAPSAIASPANQNIPVVELAARIMGKHKSVLLRFKGHTVQVFEGGQVSLVEDGRVSLVNNQSIVSFRVDKIDKNQVKISVLPYNAHLILR